METIINFKQYIKTRYEISRNAEYSKKWLGENAIFFKASEIRYRQITYEIINKIVEIE